MRIFLLFFIFMPGLEASVFSYGRVIRVTNNSEDTLCIRACYELYSGVSCSCEKTYTGAGNSVTEMPYIYYNNQGMQFRMVRVIICSNNRETVYDKVCDAPDIIYS